VRRGAVAEVEHNLVDIAPSPALWWVIAFDDRMAGLAVVLCGVTVRRVVAAADMAAGPTQAQMQPSGTDLQTLLATESAWRHVVDSVGMSAFVGHQSPELIESAGLSPASARKA